MTKNYETVFILTPVLSEVQMKDAVEKFKKVLQESIGAEIIHEENWGLRKLAYPIQHKSNGFYYLIEFKADPLKVSTLEIEYRRDEKIIRFLTTVLDKYAIDYNERRRKGLVGRKKEQKEVSTTEKEN
ncbi:30S ribosomal protein S6 [Cytophagaceae bacterium DM2B3-1]|nr:30S ribosomal protein S6 [Xanthocytophaga flavus]MDJ1467887.1 30S ribosomal protein S6 [Xanthocytophaga flavus]MDJ1479617.1 30S ribosomal protein S6 [Xanthocytophaga flavus]MDJ1493965.1 30S ribosomal protein S6 [Xanthocytophaga flavus]